MTHPVYQHPDGTICIWVDNYWFIPYDVGGEGVDCTLDHPTDVLQAKLNEIAEIVANAEDGATAWGTCSHEWLAIDKLKEILDS